METSLDIKILNIKEALILFDLIGSHIPKIFADDEDIFNFVSKIVTNIVDKNEHKKFMDVLILFTGKSVDELVRLPIQDSILAFSEGLVKNDVILLCRFFEELGYGSS